MLREGKGNGLSKLTAALVAAAVVTVAGCGRFESSGQYLESAEGYHAKGDDKAAVIQLKNALQVNPENGAARYLLGVIYADEGNLSAAEDELGKALRLFPEKGKVQSALGGVYLDKNEFQKIIDEMQPAPGMKGADLAGMLVLRGNAYVGLNQRDAAASAFAEALKADPGYTDAVLGQARLAAAGNHLEDALKFVDKAIAQSPKDVSPWILKGDLLRAASKPDAARDAYKQVLKIDGGNAAALASLASLDIFAGRKEDAQSEIDALGKVHPNSLMVHYLQAMLHFRDLKFTAARDDILQVLKSVPDHMPSILLSGSIDYQLGSYESAVKDFGRFVEAFPANNYARKMLAATQLKLKQPVDALRTLAPMLTSVNPEPQAYALAAEAYVQTGEYDKATNYLEKESAAEPSNAALRTRLAMSRLASGQSNRAISDLEAALKIDPAHSDAENALVLAYLGKKDYDRALATAQQMLKKNPKSTGFYNLEGAAYVGKNALPSARKSFEAALAVDPGFVPAMLNLGQLDMKQGNLPSASKRFEDVLARDKNNLQAMMFLAAIAMHEGQDKDYVDWLMKASKANPQSMQPRTELVRHDLQSRNIKAALEVAQDAVKSAPTDPMALDLLGSTQLVAGQQSDAAATYGKLTQLVPRSPLAFFKLGEAQAASKNAGAAEASFAKALELQPEYPAAIEALVGVYDSNGNYDAAYKAAKNYRIGFPRSPEGLILEGDIDAAQKQFDKAALAYQQAQAVAGTTVAEIKLHGALKRSGKESQANALMLQWLNAHPDDLIARSYLASVCLDEGNDRGAVQQYQAILRKAPGTLVALNNLAWLYQKSNDPRAIELARQAYKFAPGSPQIMDTLGWILVQRGDAVGGEQLLEKASALEPGAPDIAYHYGAALAKTGNRGKARQVLRKVLDSKVKFAQMGEAKALLDSL